MGERENAAAAEYERSVGADARRRQQDELRLRFPCCGELRHLGHHVACSKRPAEPDVIDGQVSLV